MVLGQLRLSEPELQKANLEFDRQIETGVAEFFQRRNPDLEAATSMLIAKVASDVIRILQTSALLVENEEIILPNSAEIRICNHSEKGKQRSQSL